jgi:signal transduction histidine kinase
LAHSLKLAEYGQIIDKKVKIDLNRLIYEINMNNKEIEIETKNVLPIVFGDKEKLMQMLTNIVTNSIIHGRATKIEIQSQFTEGKRNLKVQIKNNGVGIEIQEAKRMFERGFTTLKEGNGLGLYIVKKIIQSHDWEIELTDREQVTFTITIPTQDVII